MSSKPVRRRVLADGRYEITGRLGSGGMGEVFLATDHNLDAKVVIKIPHAAMLKDAEFAARFQREIRSLVKLRHRSIVSIMDVGEQDGVPFAVMQYLEGGSLDDRLAKGPQDEATLQQWLPDVAAALDFIHREGYIHRDIKPANILFDREGNAYVSDFGVAKVVGKGDSKQKASATMTGTGMVMGTPDYMAPELVMGESFDHRVDQYALAVTVFEVLSGRRPFEGPTPAAVMVKQCTTTAPSLKTTCQTATPHAVSTVDRALSKRAADRFDSCSQFAAAVLNTGQRNTPSGGSSVPSSSTIAVKSPGLSCPSCGAVLRLGEQHAGKTIRCSGCQERLKVAGDLSRLSVSTAGSGTSAAVASTRAGKVTAGSVRPSVVRRNERLKPLARSGRVRRSQWLVPAVVAGVIILLGVPLLMYFRGGEAPATVPQSPAQSVNPGLETATSNVSSAGNAAARLTLMPISLDPVPEETELAFVPRVIGTLTGRERFRLASGHPFGMKIEAATGRVTWTPSEADGPGDFTATVEVTDPSGSEVLSSQQFLVHVDEVNKPPVVEPIAAQQVLPGEQLKVPIMVRDPDLPAVRLRFTLTDAPLSGCRMMDDESATFVWDVPAAQPAGDYRIPIVATDTFGATAKCEILVTVSGPVERDITNSIGMKLKLIPGGEFVMGSSDAEIAAVLRANTDLREANFDDERPQHRVRISKSFYIGVTEVTQGQWVAVMGTSPWRGEKAVKEGVNYPAVYVSWHDANEFCRKLSVSEGVTYRLPTEAEWEYACRAGTDTAYSFGDDSRQLSDYAWWGGVRGGGNARSEQYAHMVGTKKPNTFGLYDMHGNVWEWCQDVYDAKSYESRSVTTVDPRSMSGSEYRVLRGGSWDYYSENARSASRLRGTPVIRSSTSGFRVVR